MYETCPYCSVPSDVVIWESREVIALWERKHCTERAVVAVRRHHSSYSDVSAEERLAIWSALDAVNHQLDAHSHTTDYAVSFDMSPGATAHDHFCVWVRPRAVTGSVSEVPGSGGRAGEPDAQLTTGENNSLGPSLFRDLERAVQVDIAVAFVFVAALNAGVLARLRDVLAREGSRVRLLTGDYQGVTEPAALRLLLTLRQQVQASAELRGTLELRVFQTAQTGSSFHPKAYLLYADAQGRSLATYVGSSNLSRTGLSDGVEWNLRLATNEVARVTREAFEQLFAHPATCEVTHDWINAYEQRRSAQAIVASVDLVRQEDPPVPLPVPNAIQAEALLQLEATREAGNRAGLVVLATGLGKTWLSAFDSTPERGFTRVLFVAHRSEILSQAMATFARIQPNASLGLYTGQEKQANATLLFASVQTLSQRAHLERFAATHFDYIVVDEFHHAASETYRRVLDYFEPKFMLGLTATPERTDGGDLLALCDDNLVFECGLVTGVRQQLLSPFHYFGVPDLVEYEHIPWRGRGFDEEALTSAVATGARAQNALEQLQRHGGSRILGFCVSQRHADFMRDYFHAYSTLRCASVHSGPTSDSRASALEQLANGELDVLFCVDMFNEGLDVPSIDTVLMLRPTESKVVWLQQLGRGLRRHANKTHLRVIDYIGNHRSFLAKPAALLAALGVNVTSPNELMRLLAEQAEQSLQLPPGCEVTYTLEAREILERLCPPSRAAETIREWYEAFRAHAERRPQAREALHSGYRPREVHKDYGSWLEFVKKMGDLSALEQQALKLNREFLVLLETVEWRKAGAIVVLDALRAMDRLPGTTTLAELALAFRHRVTRSAALLAAVGVAVQDEQVLHAALRDGPVKDLCSLRNSEGEPCFTLAGDVLSTGAGIVAGPEFQALAAEVIEWRVAEYLSKRPEEPVLDVGRDANGEPILKLDRKRYELPQDWVMVVADSANYRAHYRNHIVDSAVKGEGASNELGVLLKGWFGEEAGKRGGQHRVVQKRDKNGLLAWKPLRPAQLLDDENKPIDATFDCEDFEGEPTIVFHSRGGGEVPRNTEYGRGLDVLLERLRTHGIKIMRIAVETLATRTVPLEERVIHLQDNPYPIDLALNHNVRGFRERLGQAVAETARKKGAKGGGNATKRLRIWLQRRVDEELLMRRTPGR